MKKSPKRSFIGYSFRKALIKNKTEIKLILAAITGYSGYMGLTGFDWRAFLISIGVACITFAGKVTYDAIDFYLSEVELDDNSK